MGTRRRFLDVERRVRAGDTFAVERQPAVSFHAIVSSHELSERRNQKMNLDINAIISRVTRVFMFDRTVFQEVE
ncbi:MAG: hypothetical protein JSV36_17705, partial [Anaerolineae bacterium]